MPVFVPAQRLCAVAQRGPVIVFAFADVDSIPDDDFESLMRVAAEWNSSVGQVRGALNLSPYYALSFAQLRIASRWGGLTNVPHAVAVISERTLVRSTMRTFSWLAPQMRRLRPFALAELRRASEWLAGHVGLTADEVEGITVAVNDEVRAPIAGAMKSTPIDPQQDLIEQLRTCLAALNTAASLEIAASELGMPARTLQHRLTQAGTSFREVREQMRLDLACCLLSNTNTKIDAIAAELGFSYAQHFDTWFKAARGQTPSQFRNTR